MQTQRKLHSIHVLQRGKDFAGTIEIGAAKHAFSFSPAQVSLIGTQAVLTGTVKIGARSQARVEAHFLAMQGSILSAGPRPARLSASLTLPFPAPDESKPLTDATGPQSIAGVVYFKLSPLSGAALGVPLDLGAVQMNARLFPGSETERELAWLYSAVLAHQAATPVDAQALARVTAAIGEILK